MPSQAKKVEKILFFFSIYCDWITLKQAITGYSLPEETGL